MREYETPQEHFDRFISNKAGRYVDGLRQAELLPNRTLTKAMAERAVQEAREDFEQQTQATFERNMRAIDERYRARVRQINREGAKMALWTCPFVVVMFGLVGWFQPDMVMRLLYWVGALAFLAMLLAALWLAKRK